MSQAFRPERIPLHNDTIESAMHVIVPDEPYRSMTAGKGLRLQNKATMANGIAIVHILL